VKGLSEAMSDPEEGKFLWACSCNPDDAEARRRYLAFLVERNDERAEPLRCYLELRATSDERDAGAAQPELRDRFRVWLGQLDSRWWGVVAPIPQVYSCGSADTSLAPRVRFQFQCPNNWVTLEPTAQPDQRFCSTCGENVHWADSLVRAESLARKGACIAVPSALAHAKSDQLTGTLRGRPDWRAMWSNAIFGRHPDDWG
jgi:hypothetical protein